MVDIFQEKYFAWRTLWTPLTPWPTPSSRLKHIGRPHCYPQHDRHQHQYCHHCHMNSLSTSSPMHFSVSSRLENCHFYVSEISTILLTKNLYIVYLFKTISQNLHWWFLQIRDNYQVLMITLPSSPWSWKWSWEGEAHWSELITCRLVPIAFSGARRPTG